MTGRLLDPSTLKIIVQKLNSLFGEDYNKLIISNKWMERSDENYFIFIINKRFIRLFERNDFSKNKLDLNKYIYQITKIMIQQIKNHS